MTEEKPNLEVIEGGKSEGPYTKALNDLAKKVEEKPEISNDEIMSFYEDNKDAIDMMGGLEAFESLFALPEDQFETLKPQMLQIFEDTLNERQSERELMALILSKDYDIDEIQKERETILEAFENIDFFSESKKDLLKQFIILLTNKIELLLGKSIKTIEIPCETAEGIELPTYANEGDAGLDIYSPEEYTINPGETKIIPIGIKVAIPKGYAILIQSRSGQSAKTKLRIANAPGLIDSGYRDEIGVIIENIEPPFKDIDYEFDDKGEIHIKSILHGQSYTIAKGQRFAQMRLVQVPTAAFVAVDSVANLGDNRGGGFGHTGE